MTCRSSASLFGEVSGRKIQCHVIEMMKITGRPKVIEMGRPSHTEKLAKWINKVHYKKQKCYSSPKRDFRVQAVLTCALHKAQYELRSKQLARLVRWQRLKKDLLKDIMYGSCALHHAAEAERDKERLRRSKITAKQKELCEELKSLDDFLQQRPVQAPETPGQGLEIATSSS